MASVQELSLWPQQMSTNQVKGSHWLVLMCTYVVYSVRNAIAWTMKKLDLATPWSMTTRGAGQLWCFKVVVIAEANSDTWCMKKKGDHLIIWNIWIKGIRLESSINSHNNWTSLDFFHNKCWKMSNYFRFAIERKTESKRDMTAIPSVLIERANKM